MVTTNKNYETQQNVLIRSNFNVYNVYLKFWFFGSWYVWDDFIVDEKQIDLGYIWWICICIYLEIVGCVSIMRKHENHMTSMFKWWCNIFCALSIEQPHSSHTIYKFATNVFTDVVKMLTRSRLNSAAK